MPSRPPFVLLLRCALPLGVLACALAAPAVRAQVCPAPILYLLVRAPDGAVISADPGLTVTPTPSPGDDSGTPLILGVLPAPEPSASASRRPPVLHDGPVVAVAGRRCRLDLKDVRVAYGGEEMILQMPVRLDTRGPDRPGEVVVEVPFRPGAWVAPPVCGRPPDAPSPLRVAADAWVPAGSSAVPYAPCPAGDR